MALQKPQIVYRTIIINKDNVDNILSASHLGYYSLRKNEIGLFKYIISDDIPDPKKLSVSALVKHNDSEKVLFHEMQHWQNHNVHPFWFDNYYKSNYADCIDEVSALTAELVYTDPEHKSLGVRQTQVANSMLESSCRFLRYKFDSYMSSFIEDILQARKTGDNKVQIARLQNWQKMYKSNPNALFNREFYNITSSYFTYNGYCIFEDKIYEYNKDVWNEVRDNFNQIKQKCMNETYQMIDEIIRESR